MEHSHILLNFLVVIALAFIASANDGGYKMLSYGEDFPAYPWQRIDHRERAQHVQRRDNDESEDDTHRWIYPNAEPEIGENDTVSFPKRKSNYEEQIPEVNYFGRDSGVKVMYGRVPVPVILVTSYEKSKH